MKNLKTTMPLAVLLLAFAFSAFKNLNHPITQDAWFEYKGTGDPNDQASYDYVATDPGCNEENALCAIHATIDPNTLDPNDITTSKPLESSMSSGVITLEDLSSQSENFTQPVDNLVEFRN